jgi:integrase
VAGYLTGMGSGPRIWKAATCFAFRKAWKIDPIPRIRHRKLSHVCSEHIPMIGFDLRRLGKSMPRQRGGGHGELKRIGSGRYWARWFVYVRTGADEKRRPREKIITRELAEKYRIALDYAGPLTKNDAQRTLDLLIAEVTGRYIRPDTAANFEQTALEYIALSEPNWGPHTQRSSRNLIEKHLIEPLGSRRVTDLTATELQAFMNKYVNAGASKSQLQKMLLYLRAILELAVDKRIIDRNPARKLKAKSRKAPCERFHTLEECHRLLEAFVGRDHLIVRMLIQLGLRPEEMFGLRRDDVFGELLRVDEAIVEGQASPTKSHASNSFVYLAPDLERELQVWLDTRAGDSREWIFPSSRGGPIDHHNYLVRTLKPAARRAGVDGLNFQSLRRTSGTLFGDKAKDPKATQAHLRHADPGITLRHYQKAMPESLKIAAIAFESDLNCMGFERVAKIESAVSTSKQWSRRRDLNPRPSDYKSKSGVASSVKGYMELKVLDVA